MKKKGLIISTIVMVVVLIASLTTATYAWFSTSATTKVDTINVTIAAASDIDLGVTASTGYGDTSSNNYKYENTTFTKTGNAYTLNQGTTGLGSALRLGDFNLSTAVATTTAVVAADGLASATVGDSFDPTKTVFAANVSGNPGDTNVGTPDMANASIAVANTDYINLVLGARPNKTDVYGIVCKITVTTKGSADTLMMDAALHLLIRTGGSSAAGPANQKDLDVFSGTYSSAQMGRDTVKSTVDSYVNSDNITYSVDDDGQAVATIYFLVAGASNTSGTALNTTTIQPVQIYGFVYGPDGDCVTAATGCSCTIDMEFIAVNEKNLAEASGSNPAGVLNGVSYVSIPAIGA